MGNFGKVMGVELLWSSLEEPTSCHQKYKVKLETSATMHYSPGNFGGSFWKEQLLIWI